MPGVWWPSERSSGRTTLTPSSSATSSPCLLTPSGCLRQSVCDHLGGLLRSLVREEEDRSGDGHQSDVGGGFEGGALCVGEAAVSLLGVDDPYRMAIPGQLGGEV